MIIIAKLQFKIKLSKRVSRKPGDEFLRSHFQIITKVVRHKEKSFLTGRAGEISGYEQVLKRTVGLRRKLAWVEVPFDDNECEKKEKKLGALYGEETVGGNFLFFFFKINLELYLRVQQLQLGYKIGVYESTTWKL